MKPILSASKELGTACSVERASGAERTVDRGPWTVDSLEQFRRRLCSSCAVLLLLMGLGGCLFHKREQVGSAMLDDKVTTARVEAALKASDGKAFRSVRVQTSADVVTLSGSVPSEDARERAVQVAKSSHRAGKIENHIQVRR
jgi:hypothetical protein